MSATYVVGLETVSMRDVARVGGKNASLGELLRHLSQAGVRAVGGFATEVSAYAAFLAANGLGPVIEAAMTAHGARQLSLDQAGKRVRDALLAAPLPAELADAIRPRSCCSCLRLTCHGRVARRRCLRRAGLGCYSIPSFDPIFCYGRGFAFRAAR